MSGGSAALLETNGRTPSQFSRCCLIARTVVVLLLFLLLPALSSGCRVLEEADTQG